MRPFLWLLVVVSAAAVLVVPAVYLYVGSQLPPLESEFDLERLLRQSIESERRSQQVQIIDKSAIVVPWERPDFGALPKNIVALYITERGCPTYFQTPREEGGAWVKRVVGGMLGNEPDDPDGWCERIFTMNLAQRVGAKGKLQEGVAVYKMHRYLKKDDLIAYDLNAVRLAPGIIGVHDAAKALFHKPLADLSLHELAELMLAIPPHGYYQQILLCQNPSLIRQNRDVIIDNLRRVGMVPEDVARAAKREDVACRNTP